MYLSETTHSLIAVTDAGATTTEPRFWSSYVDIGTGDFAPTADAGNFNGTTDITLVDAPVAGLTRQVKHLAIYNADSVSHTVTVKFLDDFTERVVGIFPLAAGETLEYTQEHGWKTYPLPVAGTFLALTDVPSSFSGQGSKLVRVNSGESALEFTSHPYDFGFSFEDTPGSSDIIGRVQIGRDVTLPANMSGASGTVDTNPTSSFAVDVQDDGVSIGTITISTGGAFTFVTASGTAKSIAAGSAITFIAPGSADATIAGVAVVLLTTVV